MLSVNMATWSANEVLIHRVPSPSETPIPNINNRLEKLLVKYRILGAVRASLLIAASGAAQAALIDRGGGLIYDTDLNITWLANANYGAGSSYDTADGYNDGSMTWQNAMDWTANLAYYDSVRDVVYDDWRLPAISPLDPSCAQQYSNASYGLNCTGSEFGHVVNAELGLMDPEINLAYDGIYGPVAANYGPFTNVRPNGYWFGTEYSGNNAYAWTFIIDSGNTGFTPKAYGGTYAWAVRDGDVYSVSTVPVPAAIWLLGSGLLGLIAAIRRRH